MKIKLLTLTAIMAAISLCASAQITTGEPSAKVIRTGNRAQAGDFGLYLGVKTDMFKDIFDSDVSLKALPLINFKYMGSDHSELRLGFEFYQTSEKIKGDAIVTEDTTTEINNRDGQTDVMFYPGYAYHFGRHNILDVYVGVELPLGWSSNSNISGTQLGETMQTTKITKRSFVIGIGAFVGLQAYIANLPLAIGIEYGISSRFDTGLKYKNEITADGKTQTYYEVDQTAFNNLNINDESYKKLSAKKGDIGNQVRLTFTYYFK